MRTVGTAAAVGLATGIVGGVVGYFLVRLLVERLGIVEGPPAGVLLFTLSPLSHCGLRVRRLRCGTFAASRESNAA
jgi:hypothetical protein